MAEPGKQFQSMPATSSVPEVLPEEQELLFRQVLRVLEDRDVPFAVSGAFALRQHTGICRFTKDLDLFLSARDATAALGYLQEQGFECEVRDPVWLAKAHRDGFFVDLITGMSNAVIHVDASWIARAHPAEVMGVLTRVLAPEELLASKLFVVRRERFDGADIAHIIFATRGRLDWDRVVQLAGEHWEILLWALLLFRYAYPGQSQYVPKPVWNKLLGQLRHEVLAPNPRARFRGSLIDDCMFAIDLQEWGLDNLLAESRARAPKILPPAV
jgi:hypothetical protein